MDEITVQQQFVYSGSKPQQLRDVVKQLRREGKVVLVVKPGQPVSVFDNSDFVIHDEDLEHWEWRRKRGNRR